MTDHQAAYKFIMDTIDLADTYFAFKCVDYNLEHFKSCYPEMRTMRSELIDARCDKWQQTFNPLFKQKNQNDAKL